MTNKIQLNAQIDLLDDDELKEAFASVSLNPSVQWAKIVVTDDKPNLNKQRIPKDEFANLIETGLFAPIKMTESTISRTHKEALGKVIGTITQLVEDNDKVIALSALWKKERPQDIEMLKDMYSKGNLPQVSWEISYAEATIEDEIEVLHNTSLNGLTVVSDPAYAGRTAFVSMASTDSDKIPTEEELNKIMEDLEKANERIKELEDQISESTKNLETANAELGTLREYKDTIEKEKADAEKFETIKTKFASAKIQKDESYFTTNKEFLLGLDEKALDFMLQEFVAFKPAEASTHTDEIPNFINKETSKVDPKELGKALRERSLSK